MLILNNLFLLAAFSMLIACSKSDTPENLVQDDLIGNWYAEKVTTLHPSYGQS